jgi:hypothetical protein
MLAPAAAPLAGWSRLRILICPQAVRCLQVQVLTNCPEFTFKLELSKFVSWVKEKKNHDPILQMCGDRCVPVAG